MALLAPPRQKILPFAPKIVGFYCEISDKFHPVARAYCPKLADTNPAISLSGQILILDGHPSAHFGLSSLWIYGLLQASPFKSEIDGKNPH